MEKNIHKKILMHLLDIDISLALKITMVLVL